MKAFGGFLLTLLVIVVIVGVVGVISYTHEMAPTWAEIAKQQADLDIAIAKQNAQSDIARHSAVSMAIGAGSWVLVLLLLAGGVVWFVWKPMDERKESWARQSEGSFALQTMTNGETVWVMDPNKIGGDAVGLSKSTGLLGEHASQFLGPDRQLTQNLAVQKTRSIAAKAPDGRKPTRNELMDNAGVFDAKAREANARADMAELRRLAQTPANDDGDPITEPIELLTLKQAVERSTPEAWIIGQNQETGKLAYFKPNEAIHLAILGATGTGKTESTGMLIVGYALKNGYRVSILDGKGGADWSKFSRWCEYQDTDNTNFVGALESIREEYERRAELVSFENAPKPQPMLVLIEEYGDINDSLMGEVKERANVILDTLIRKARHTGIHLCFIDQYPEKWNQQLLQNTKNKVVYWLNDGAIVKEYKVHTLAENGEFFLKGEKYKAWHVKPMVKAFLSDVPAIEAKSFTPSFSKPFNEPFNRSTTPVDPPPPEQSERVNAGDPTDLEALVWQWRAEHPEGTQAELRRDFQRRRIEISKGHVFNCWHSWPNASPMAWQEEGENEG